MTSLGHILTGAAIGIFSIPSCRSRWCAIAGLTAIIAVANLPDWPLPGWGHERLSFSHSLFVNAVTMACIAAIAIRFAGASKMRPYRALAIGGMAAWLSHFLLDTLYGDAGVAILWPFSSATVSLPIPWLHTMPHVPPPFDREIARIMLMELLTFGPLPVVAILVRRHRNKAKTLTSIVD